MNGKQFINRFQFNNHYPLNQEVNQITTFKLNPLVNQGNRMLANERNTTQRQFPGETEFIGIFEEPRPQSPMNLDSRPDYRLGNLINSLRLCASAVQGFK